MLRTYEQVKRLVVSALTSWLGLNRGGCLPFKQPWTIVWNTKILSFMYVIDWCNTSCPSCLSIIINTKLVIEHVGSGNKDLQPSLSVGERRGKWDFLVGSKPIFMVKQPHRHCPTPNLGSRRRKKKKQKNKKEENRRSILQHHIACGLFL